MLRRLWRSLRTRIGRKAHTTDHARWRDPRNLSSKWDARTRRIAELVPPGASVIEFGAGRRVLEAHLPDGCTYTPSDLVDRGAGTIVCDLNATPLATFPPHEVAVFSGVIEYIHDIPRLIARLADTTGTIIASYAVLETNRKNRRANGWINDLDETQLVALFAQGGYALDHAEKWQSQMIYRFVRRRA